jgi:hypothetical protein
LKGAFPSPDLEFIASFDRKKLTGELARVLSGSLRVI